jgi:hypothetical protein
MPDTHLQRATALSVGLLALLAAVATAAPARGALCSVPGSHSTIQAAVLDLACDPIELGDLSLHEVVTIPRSLTLRGANGGSSVLIGRIQATGGSTQIALEDLEVDARSLGYDTALAATDGARVSAFGVLARNGLVLFADGFESGDVSNWSAP